VARVQIFLSAVSAEFRSYRDTLRHDLTRPNFSVAVQEDFIVTGTETLDMLDDYLRQCDAVIHLVGDMTGALAQAPSLTMIRSRYPDLGERLPPLAPCLQPGAPALSCTQWEAWLALYHGKPLIIAAPEDGAPRDARYELIPEQRAAQQAHLQRLAEVERYPGIRFASPERLAVEVLRSKLFDIFVAAGIGPASHPSALSQPRRPVQGTRRHAGRVAHQPDACPGDRRQRHRRKSGARAGRGGQDAAGGGIRLAACRRLHRAALRRRRQPRSAAAQPRRPV
jgi:hypothetical protein